MLLTMIEESIEMLSMHARNVISLLPCETADTHLDGTIDPPPLHEQLHRVGSLATEKEQLCLAGLVCWQFLHMRHEEQLIDGVNGSVSDFSSMKFLAGYGHRSKYRPKHRALDIAAEAQRGFPLLGIRKSLDHRRVGRASICNDCTVGSTDGGARAYKVKYLRALADVRAWLSGDGGRKNVTVDKDGLGVVPDDERPVGDGGERTVIR
mmetsp:Transcript_25448/g.77257  ORF Transcript_25448/g.77257 Transcript_25448/m.77257 type:complete len:208 (+) Transcript_25448:746-1369(+)